MPGLLANDVNNATSGKRIANDADLDDADGGQWDDEVLGSDNWTIGSNVTHGATTSAFPGISNAFTFTPDGSANDGMIMQSLQDIAGGNPTNGDASFELWFRPNDFTGTTDEILFETGATTDGLVISLNGSSLNFITRDNGGPIVETSADLSSIGAGEFIQVVGVVDYSSTNDLLLYVNGNLVSQIDMGGYVDWAGGSDSGLGTDRNGSALAGVRATTDFDGEIAKFCFYDSALDAGQVLDNFEVVSNADPDGDNSFFGMTVTSFDAVSANGATVVVNPDGSYSYDPTSSAAIQALAAGTVITDTFTYTITDEAGNTDTATVSIEVTRFDDVPVAVNDNITVTEDTVFNGDVSGNDTLSNNGGNVFALTTPATNGAVVMNPDGTFSYTPNPNFSGTDSFTYTITDADGDPSTATVFINVTPVDDPTVIGGDTTGSGAEDGGNVTGTLTASDVDGLAANPFSVTTGATNGTAVIDPVTGAWTYTPNADYNGPDSFTVTVTDALGNTTTQVIGITVTPVADITDDTLTTLEDNAISANVLTGTNGATADTFEGTPSVTAVTQGTNGSVVFDAAGNITYTPNANFSGVDSFTYTVTSGGVTETATVTVNVTPVDDPTVIGGDTTGSGAEDGGNVTGTLTASDVDGLAANPFSVTTGATNGTAVIDPVTGAWTYTPNADYNGPDSFTVTVTDALGNTTTQVIGITVTPVADITDDTLTTLEDNAISANVLTGTNGATADTFEGTPSVTAVTQGTNGSVVFDAAGNITYTPNANFSGVDSFTYTVTSGGVTETATVTVNVTPVDDPTVIGGDTTGSGAEDGGNVTGTLTASDVDGLAANPFSVTTGATNGTAVIDPVTGAWTYTPNADYNGPDSFTVTVTDALGNTTTQVIGITVTPVADITDDTLTTLEDNAISANVLVGTNGATADTFEGTPSVTAVTQGTNGSVVFDAAGNITYTPNANFSGVDSFTYTVTSGGVTETATVTVNVTPVDDPTVIGGDTTGSGAEDGGNVTGTLTASDVDGLAANPFSVTTGATNGTAVIDPVTGAWTYTPNADYNGPDSFTVTVTDALGNTTTQVIGITVTPVADITDDTLTTLEDNAISANVLVGTNGATADTFEGTPSVTAVTQGTNGSVVFDAAGNITYTPNANFSGVDSFTYTVTSGGVTETATVTVNVTPVDDPTVIGGDTTGSGAEDGGNVTGTLTASDVDGLAANPFSVTTGATNGTAVIDPVTGAWTYTPNADYNGPDSFTVTVTDALGNTTTQVIGITVTPVADITDDTLTTLEDNAISANVLVGTNGATADTFEGTPSVTAVTQGTNGSVVFDAAGNITYTPNANFSGVDSFTYTVTSGGVTETATVTVNVTPVDDPTVIGGDTTGSGAEDGGNVTGTLTASDVDGLAANPFSVTTGATNGTAVIDPVTGAWTYTPNADYNGPDSFTVTVTDALGNTTTQVIGITVTPVADITDDTLTTLEDNAISANVLVGTNGATADTFEGTPSVTAVTQGTNGSVVFDAAGNITYTPNANFSGVDSFTYTVTSGGVTETATVTVNVTPVDDPTVIGGDTTGSGAEDGGNVTGTLTASDVDGLAANPFSVTTGATNGTAVIDPVTGAWTYTPNADYNGPDSFTVTVTDALGNTTTQVIGITVTPVADITDDTLTTLEDNAISANVLVGTNGATADTFEGTPSVTAVTQGTNGSVVFDAAGNITYTPNANFSGVDSFTYTVTSGGVTETATVTVNVTPVDDPTVIGGDTTGSGAEDGGNVTGTLTASDVDGLAANPFSVTTGATNGTAVIDPVTGAWTYTPNADYNGPDSFTVTVTDALGNTTTQVIGITVTPVADITDDTLTTLEDNAISANVLVGTNGATADTFEGTPSVTAVTQGTNGSVVFDAAGNITYTPNANFSGVDSFTYTVTSGGVTETATVTVNVTPVDDPTVIGGDTTGSGAEDGGNVTGTLTASDVDGLAANPFSVTTGATNGTAVIDPVTGAWTYTPNADYNGPDSFTVTVTDALGNTTTQVIGITVTPVADITDDTLTTLEDNAISANVLVGTNGATADTFEGTPSVTAVTQGTNGSVVFDAAGNITYTPNANFSGVDSFTYTVTSGGVTETATVTVNVTPVDDPTVIGGDTTGSGAEDGGNVTGTLTASDVDGLAANPFSVTTGATNGTAVIDPVTGAWTYTPNADYNGPDSFTVTVTDALGNTTTQVIGITVTPVADITDDTLTTLEDNAISANVLVGTNGATADTFEGTPSVTAVTQGTNGSVVFDAAGNITYTPNANFSGVDSFTYTVTSGGVTETATVTVNVTPVDDPTVIGGDTTGSGAEDGGNVTGTLTASDVDGLAANPFSVTTGATNGTAVIDPVTGAWTYTPNADYNGPDSFTVTVTDALGNTTTQVIGITVTPVADITDDTLTTLEDNAISANVLVGTNGATADTFEGTPSVTAVTQGTNGSVVFDAAGNITYTPNANFSGVDSFTYTVTSGGVTETATVTVNVTPVDDPTVIGGDTTGSGAEDGGNVTGTLTASDVDGLAANPFSVTTGATNGTAVIDPVTGAWTYTPNADYNGPDSFTVTVTDALGNTTTQVIGITVTPVADITDDTLTTLEDNAISANVLVGTNGATADTFEGTPSVTAVTQGTNGSVVFDAAGNITYTPNANFSGVDSFTYTVTSGGVTETATVTVNVTPVDDPTVIGGDTTGSGAEDGGNVTGTLTASDVDGLAANPFSVTTGATNGTAVIDPVTGAWTYTPNADYNGPDSFTVTVTDALGNTTTQVIGITVTPVADITDDTLTTLEDNAISANVLVGTNGATADTFEGTPSVTAVTQGTNGSVVFDAAGNITYTPNANFSGVDSFTYTVTSGGVTETATVTVNVTPVDDPTVIGGDTTGSGAEDGGNVTGTLTASDVDGLAANPFSVTTGATNGTAVIDPVTGAWTYTPNADYNGPDSFTVTVTDALGNTTTQVIGITVTPVADITDDTLTTLEDNAISANVLVGTNGATADTFEGTPSVTAVTQGTNGSVVFDAAGNITYTPNANFSGVDSFTYTVTSGGVTETATVTVNVTPVDDPTVIGGDTTGSGAEDGGNVTGTLTASDVDGLAANPFSVTTGATNGTAVIDPVTGAWTYTPNADYNGPDSFTVTVTDALGNTTTQVIGITVTPVADITDDTLTTLEDNAISANVLVGTNGATADTFEGTPSVTAVTQGTNGSVVFDAAGNITYTPNANFSGVDSFTYTVTSGGVTETATVTVNVTPVDDPTVIGGDTTGSGAEDGGNVTGTLTASDVDGLAANPFSVTTGATNGTAVIDPVTGAWTYTPNADYNGPDSFTVTVTDALGNTTTQVIGITVTPVADITDDTLTTLEDNAISANVLVGTNGATADTFEGTPSVTAVTQGTNGSVVFDAAGNITYTPNANFSGVDSFTYTVTSGGVTETATVTVNVTPVDDPTVIGGDTTGSGAEDGGNVTGTLTASDVDGLAANPFSVTTGATNGTAVIDPVTGAWTYTPNADYNGPDSFTVTVTDALGNTTTQVIGITVTPVADITDDTLTTLEDNAISANVLVGTNGATADTFEGTPSVTAVTQGTNGSVVFDAAGNITYTPNANFSGVDSFTYTVTSGGVTETATVTVNVTPVDDPTVIGGDTTGSGAEDGGNVTGTLTASDVDGLAANPFSVTTGATNGTAVIDPVTGAWTYTPNADYNGPDSFTVTVTDALGNTTTQVIGITVTPVADITDDTLTTLEDNAISANVLVGTNGATADTFEGTPSVTAVTQGTNGSVVFDAAGNITYTPNANFSGVDSFTYTVTSGGVTETATVTVNVTPVDDPTVIGGDTTGSGAEDGGNVTGTLTASDVDGLAANPFSVTTGATNGTAVIDPVTGAWTYTPNADYNGPDSFTVTVTDALGNTTTQVIGITVTPVADITDDTLTTLEDNAISANVLVGTNGATADTFEGTPSVTAVTQGTNGSVVFDAAGNITYTPNANFSGVDSFTYTVTSGGVTETATVTVNVTPVDDPTVIGGDTTGSGAEDGGNVTGTLTASDVDGLAANPFSVTTGATNGTAVIDPVTGAWTYTPNADYNGPDSFTVTVTDALGNTTTQVIGITVTPVADITDDTLTTLEDNAISANVLVGTNGATADTFEGTPSVTAVTQGTNGSVVFDAAGNITYTPNANFSGVDSFTYTVTSGGVTETATVTVNVTPVDDPTVIGGDTTGSGAEDGGNVTGTLTASDVDGLAANPFSVTTGATNGTAVIDPVTGAWTYTPNADYNGPDSFTVTVTDALGNTTTQVIGITVTPVADITDDTLTTLEDNAISANVLVGTNGATADTFEGTPSVTAVTQGTNGSVVFDAAGNITYTPNANFSGVDSFTYTVTSGGVTETATVTVNVTPVDDPTVIGGDTTGSGAEDGGNVTGTLTASDVDGLAANPFSVTTGATNGTAVIDPVTGAWTYTPNADYNGPDSFTVTVTDALGNTTTQVIGITVTPVADITDDTLTTLEDNAISANVLVGTNGATADTFEGTPSVTAVTQGTNGSVVFDAAGNITYTPNANFSGVDSFTYTVTSGGVTETATVTVNVTPVDDPTVIGGDTTGSGAEDGGNVTGTLTASDVDGLAANPFSVTTGATNGTAVIDPVTGAWTYTPNADYNGPDSFTVTVTDALGNTTTQVIGITVTPVADITDDTLTTLEDNAISANVLVGTNGATADTFEGTPSVTAVTQGTNGSVVFDAAGNITYTPNANFSGVDSFTYTVTSGGVTETATVTVNVTPVNDPSVPVDDTATTNEDTAVVIPVLANDTDIDGNNATLVSATNGTNGTTSVNTTTGEVTYTPNPDFFGTDTFTYTNSEGNTATVTVTVIPTPDAVNDIDGATEGGAPVTGNVLNNDDIGTGPTEVTGVTEGGTPITLGTPFTTVNGGILTINDDGTYSYTPPPTATVPVTGVTEVFTYTVTDNNGNTSTATLTINVVDQGDLIPDAADDVFTTAEDTLLAGDVSGNDPSPGDAPATYTAPTASTNGGTVTMNPNGTFTYNPPTDFFGTDTFTYTVTDNDGDIDTALVTITVTPVNDDPVANDDGFTVLVNSGTTNLDVITNDTDVDGGPLTITAVTPGTAGGTVVINGNTIDYTPPPNFVGTETFTYTIDDGNGGTSTATVTMTVNALPSGPGGPLGPDEAVPENLLRLDDGFIAGGVNAEYNSISAPGAVIDTVRSINSEQFGDQIEGAAADSFGLFDANSVKGFSLRSVINEANDNSFDTLFPLRLGEGDAAVEGGDELIVETLIKNRTLYVEIDYLITSDPNLEVEEIRVTQVSGDQLPDWLRFDEDERLVVGEPPVDAEVVEFRVEVTLSNDTEVLRYFEVEVQTGVIGELSAPAETENLGASLFSDQVEKVAGNLTDSAADLAQALAQNKSN